MGPAKRLSRLPPGAAAVCLLAFCAGASSGCSFFLSQGPPANVAQLQEFKCEESYAPPIVDTVLASAGLVATLGLNSVAHALNSSGNARIGVFALITVGVPGVSAVYGYTQVGRCRAAEHHARNPGSNPSVARGEFLGR